MEDILSLKNKKMIGVAGSEDYAIPIKWGSGLVEEDYKSCNIIALAATIARTIDESALSRIIIYDIVAYRPKDTDKIQSFYVVGKIDKTAGVWRIQSAGIEKNSFYNIGWELVWELPNFKDAAIAFDGVWELEQRGRVYTLHNEGAPWVFYVTEKGTLFAQNGKGGLVTELATGVSNVAAEKGYFPKDYPNIATDQGIVVTYASSDNKIKYRTYAYISEDKKTWLEEEEIANYQNNQITNISIHRLNDYRIGINITAGEKAYWHISNRAYSQMAFRPEYFNIATGEAKTAYMGMCFNKKNSVPQPTFIYSLNEEGTEITIESNMQLKFYNNFNLKEYLSGTVNMPKIQNVYLINGGYTIKIIFEKAATATFSLFYSGGQVDFSGNLSDLGSEYAGQIMISAFSHEFEFFLKNNYNELFVITTPIINTVSIIPVPKTILTNKYAEKFIITTPAINEVNITPVQKTMITIDNYKEQFSVASPIVEEISITLEHKNIVPV